MKTIGKVVMSLIFLSATLILNAQKMNYGIQAGSNFAVQSQIGDYYNNEDIRIGWHAGVYAKYSLINKIAIQAEVNYDQLGSKSSTNKNKFDYINIPVLFNYSIGKSDLTALTFDLYTGPYAGFLINAKNVLSTQETETTTDLKQNTNKITGGAILGFGLRYPVREQKILFDIRLGLGLAPYDKNSNVSKNKYVSLSLGYQF